jgi:N-acetylglucosaminyldiphosphoundecaprenol N-acetyl-beta-D-mannosaminyltransferase
VPIFDGTPEEARDYCLHAARTGVGARIATANLDFLAQARTNETLLDDLQGSSLIVADGAPVVTLARMAGALRVERTAGVDLAIELCRAGGEEQEFRVALYGGEPGACRAAAERLESLAPHTRVVLTHCPPFRELTDEEQEHERALIAAADPHLVLVGLGCPKQEHRIREYYEAAPGAVWIGVGGAFEMIAGQRRRAGRLVQQLGLEWLVRMAQDPGRLARRYLGRDVPALPLIAADVVIRRLTSAQVSAARGDN